MALTFAVVVHSHPLLQQGSLSAYRFTQAAIAQGHQVQQIFFYGAGASHGNALSVIPQDETDINQQWQTLANRHHIPLNLCSGSALRQGILDDTEAQRHQHLQENLMPGFQLVGLGELAKAYQQADRVVVFGT